MIDAVRLRCRRRRAIAERSLQVEVLAWLGLHDAFDVVASDAHGAVAESCDRQATGADPAPDADPTDAEESSHFGDAVEAALGGSWFGRGYLHVFQTVTRAAGFG